MLHSALHPGLSTIDNTGVFALRDIPMGTALWWPCPKCPIVPLSQQYETPTPVTRWFAQYGYRRFDGSLIAPCRGAYLLNHSCEASVLDLTLAVGIAVRDIQRGEEVTCDYRTFRHDTGASFPCRCAADGCVGTVEVSPGRPPAELSRTWSARIRPALEAAALVPQETTVRAGDVNGRSQATGRIRVR